MCKYVIFLALGVFAVGNVKAGAEYCRTGYYTWDIKYCDYGCCGTYPNAHCCTGNYMPTWVIILIVIGSIIVISVIVAVICYCKKTGQRPGHVVAPMAAGHVHYPVTHAQVFMTNPHSISTNPYPGAYQIGTEGTVQNTECSGQ